MNLVTYGTVAVPNLQARKLQPLLRLLLLEPSTRPLSTWHVARREAAHSKTTSLALQPSLGAKAVLARLV